jgi:2-keto-4-pentenoate hydratase/2-oxohepta-3-ene-1,7-dioic acid hydratase in catechol pathway
MALPTPFGYRIQSVTKLCRFNDNRLGVIEADEVIDVTLALDLLPEVRWPLPQTDLLILHLAQVLPKALELTRRATRVPLTAVKLLSPVANPPKVIAAPVNYLRHQAEALADGGVNFEKDVKTIAHYGLFLKSSTSIVGPGEGIPSHFPERRTDHEIELVAVIGKGGRDIAEPDALDHIAGYAIGLDMTLRGTEDRSLRKSLDGFSVLGPWLVTADEIPNPNDLWLSLHVNGELRQRACTRDLIFPVQRLVSYASKHYKLCPGDVIYTGTPEGVGPVKPGDRLTCAIEKIGTMETHVRSAIP